MLEHAFKLFEKILDGHLCEVVDIDKMQYRFMPGREIFVNLEKAFDWVPTEIICFALRWKCAPEYLVDGVMSL